MNLTSEVAIRQLYKKRTIRVNARAMKQARRFGLKLPRKQA